MNILAIDTTTKKANVALLYNNKNYINTIDNEITHSEKLLPLIDKTLKQAECDIKNINLLACTTGPGSFTGIRIGIATIKALAKVIDAKIYAINSLELLAHSTLKDNFKIVVPLIDAKNARAYFNIYENTNSLIEVTTSSNKYISEIIETVRNYCNSNNLDISYDVLFILDNENLKEYLLNLNYTTSSLDMNVLLLLAKENEQNSNILELDATYIRNSEAERTKYGE